MRRRMILLAVLVLSGCGVGRLPSPLPPASTPPEAPTPAPATATPRPSVEGRIAFSAGHELWLSAGSSASQLTHLGAVQNPAWSPDGSTLAFDRAGKNSADLWLMPYPGGPARPLTNNAAPAVDGNFWEMQPSWSPDGKALVYASDRGRLRSGTLDLAAWQIAIASRARTQLSGANPYTGGIDYPSWRPGAASPQLLYTSWTYQPNDPNAYGQLELLDPRTRATWVLSPRGQTVLQASWSPDGSHLAFVRRIDGQDQVWTAPVPFVVGADVDLLAGARLLVGGVNAHPAWSPAGDAIAYIGLQDGSFDLHVQLLTTGLEAAGPPRQLTHSRHLDADSAISWGR
jgi:Tol biopolymer transport system component